MSLSVQDWITLQQQTLDIIKGRSSKVVSFDSYEDRVCMNRSLNEMRKLCIIDNDTTGEALCVAKLKTSVKKLKAINEKKHKHRQGFETEINSVL